jgi:predicted ATP-grasp superfamily ATP-dependent carboligase
VPIGLKKNENRQNHQAPSSLKQKHYDVLVLDAWTRQSLTTVRSLGNRKLQVAALTTRDTLPSPAFSSRWCQQKFVCPAQEGTQDYLAYLQQILETTSVHVLIPASDGTIAIIRRYRTQLEHYTHIALAKEPALGIAINKEQTLQIAKAVGLAIPKGVRINASDEVEAALHEIGLPAVIKPIESWNKQGEIRQESKLVTTREEAHCAVELLTRRGGAVLFQQFLPGIRESVSLFYTQGQIIAKFAHQIQRTNPPLGGTDVLRHSIAVPTDIGEQAERLVREIDLEGYCLVEFRRDSAGTPYLMEINSRLSAGIELAVRAGVDFPYLLYQWALGDPLNKIQGYRVGYRMRDLGSDIAATAATILHPGRPGVAPPAQAIRNFSSSFFLPTRYDYLDNRDLLPAGTAIAGWCRNLPRLIGDARARRSAQASVGYSEPTL